MEPFLAAKEFKLKSFKPKIRYAAYHTRKRRNSSLTTLTTIMIARPANRSKDKTFFLLLFIGSKLNKSVGLLLTYSSSKLLFSPRRADAIQQVCNRHPIGDAERGRPSFSLFSTIFRLPALYAHSTHTHSTTHYKPDKL